MYPEPVVMGSVNASLATNRKISVFATVVVAAGQITAVPDPVFAVAETSTPPSPDCDQAICTARSEVPDVQV